MPEPASRVLHPDDLFALEYVHDARLSPDGQQVAAVISRTPDASGDASGEEYFEIFIVQVSTGARRPLSFSGRASTPRWSPDGKRLAFIGADQNSQRLYVANVAGDELTPLTPRECQVQGPPDWSPDGRSIAYTVVTRQKPPGLRRITKRVFRSEGLGLIDDLRLRIEVVDVQSHAVRCLDSDLPVATRPVFSPCGRSLLFFGADSAVGWVSFGGLKLFRYDLREQRTTEVLGQDWYIAGATWTADGERIVVAGDYRSDITVPTCGLWIVNRDGSEPRCRTSGYVGNVGLRVHHDMPTWNTSQNDMLAVFDAHHAFVTVQRSGCAEIWRVALEGEPDCTTVVSGPRSCLIMSVNAAAARLLYCVSDLRTPWNLYVSDLAGRDERPVIRLNEAVLSGWPALQVEHLEFNSADGLPLEAWYVRRQDRTGPQPTVMFIHGGPYLGTGNAFRFDFHLLAANGYAVLLANFRGSAGYGAPFARSIMGDWGARGFADHMAALDSAIARGWSDPQRLGVWGPSHGGFATCWMVGHTTRFRAAVAEAAVTNFSSLYYLCDAPDIFIRELGGKPHEIPDVYRSRSPLTYAWRCRTPTLLLHGEEDNRCPVAEAEQFYRALHDVGCTTELVRIPGADHMGDSTGPLAARQAQNEALLDWFERYL